ncbi:hypothetical protein BO99DRAFT_417158 [Aspergillus violaceofuscus CBS 115571]|uniref:Uncharacterized protein n=1 Tax=Aspergillus violaceofuscus (strain CBS 115571) TaxID=1450538 RepID=A0A2V5GS40_ASPV1|nr:hypothetical protein BO99DRAFT_417158 [Aspergillus violaceofuscus CBS 115571]
MTSIKYALDSNSRQQRALTLKAPHRKDLIDDVVPAANIAANDQEEWEPLDMRTLEAIDGSIHLVISEDPDTPITVGDEVWVDSHNRTLTFVRDFSIRRPSVDLIVYTRPPSNFFKFLQFLRFSKHAKNVIQRLA